LPSRAKCLYGPKEIPEERKQIRTGVSPLSPEAILKLMLKVCSPENCPHSPSFPLFGLIHRTGEIGPKQSFHTAKIFEKILPVLGCQKGVSSVPDSVDNGLAVKVNHPAGSAGKNVKEVVALRAKIVVPSVKKSVPILFKDEAWSGGITRVLPKKAHNLIWFKKSVPAFSHPIPLKDFSRHFYDPHIGIKAGGMRKTV
jgi:hypothetical protein